MKWLLLASLAAQGGALALSLGGTPLKWLDRRSAVGVGAAVVVGAALRQTPARAEESSSSSLKPLYKAAVFAKKTRRYAPGEARAPEDFEQGSESPFVGSYTDPFHPEGARTITLGATQLGEFRTATVDGRDTPQGPAFSLPALVFADQITVDFRPKGGPENLTGFFSGNAIKWPDGNKWPRVSS